MSPEVTQKGTATVQDDLAVALSRQLTANRPVYLLPCRDEASAHHCTEASFRSNSPKQLTGQTTAAAFTQRNATLKTLRSLAQQLG